VINRLTYKLGWFVSTVKMFGFCLLGGMANAQRQGMSASVGYNFFDQSHQEASGHSQRKEAIIDESATETLMAVVEV